MQTLLCLSLVALFVVHIATAAELGDEELMRTFSEYFFSIRAHSRVFNLIDLYETTESCTNNTDCASLSLKHTCRQFLFGKRCALF
jgi:hypothetical protein